MLDAAHPGGASLDPHSKTTMRDAAVATQIEVPLKRLLRKFMQRDLLLQKLQRRRAFSASDYLAIPFRREHVDSKRKFRTLRISRHVKCFHRRRIVMDHYRLFKLTRNIRFVRRAEVATPFELRLQCTLFKSLMKKLHRLVVMNARKWRRDSFQFRRVALQHFQLFTSLFEHLRRDV